MKALKRFWLKSRVLVCLCLGLLLSSCSSPRIKTVDLTPPQAYLTPCPKTPFTGESYGDAVDYLVVVMGERDLCASQLKQVSEWVKAHSKSQ